MRICIVQALDHYNCIKREHLVPEIIDAIGEHFQENEDYLILRSFHCYDRDKPDNSPNEKFSAILKAVIKKRIDIDVDLEKQVFIGILEGVRIQEK